MSLRRSSCSGGKITRAGHELGGAHELPFLPPGFLKAINFILLCSLADVHSLVPESRLLREEHLFVESECLTEC